MARIIIDLNEGPLLEKLEEVKAKMGNLRPLMESWKALAVTAVDGRFKRQGPGWPPHSEITKARRGANAPLLVDAGTLRKGITGETSDGFTTVGDDYVEIGTNLKYARIHNFGGEVLVKARKSKNPDYRRRKDAKDEWTVKIPQRRFLPTQEELMPALVAEAETYIEDLLQE